MTTPKEALERALEYLDGDSPMHSRGGHRNETLRAEIKLALASLQGEDAVERVALRRIILDILNDAAPAVENLACNQEQMDADGCMVKVSRQAIEEVLAAVNEVAIQAATATGLVPDEAAIRVAAFNPTDAQINSACLSFRHDYGLLDDHDRKRLRFVAVEWLRAWQKEGFGCDRDEVIERCAAVVDQCNREGPYEAIASAKRIRALKSAAIRSGGGE